MTIATSARLGVALCLTALSIWASLTTAPAARHELTSRSPLPTARLEFGLDNLDVTWMTSSGVPWRYRFQYLAGGVNTPNNWLTWQDPAKPPGQFALDYMTASAAAPANYIPVFTWYQLLQSTPSAGTSELERDYNNLNNAATMDSYFASFKVLMLRAGEFGGQVVIHVEPDFWGYMQQKAAGGDAAAVAAKVKSSGFPEAAAFADNVAGFAAELKYLRDTYAPNALLAMHASLWASSIDIGTTTDPTVNTVAEADKTAAFLSSAGAGTWDAVFNDVDDHNAAWWELASCSTPPCVNQYFTHWWDTTNTRFPNFTRYLSWVSELHARTGLPQLVWQVPMGNQYFLTMNNTCGHYQDNVAPYFIAHSADLFAAGLVAVLFGTGNSCQTTYDDSQGDGVTNNGGVQTTDALGGCNACNTHASTFSDDDGGYLRIFVGKYYAGQLPCALITATATPPSPQAPGANVTLTASAAGCANPQYEFWVLAPGTQTWQSARGYATAPALSWGTTGKVGGTYRFSIWARDSTSPGIYGNALGTWGSYTTLTYTLTATPCGSVGAATSPLSPEPAGTAVTVSATAYGCPNPRYEFWIFAPGASTWQPVQLYSSSASLAWNTAGRAAGTYSFSIWARDASSPGIGLNALGTWDAYAVLHFTITSMPCTSVSASASGAGTVTVSGAALGCPNPQYEFWVLTPGSQTWQLSGAYSSSPTLILNMTGKPAGVYRFSVWARDASSVGLLGNGLGRWDSCAALAYSVT